MITLTEFKNEFSDREGIQFNNAGVSVISKRVAIKVVATLTEHQRKGGLMDKEWIPELKRARETIAKLIDADSSEIAFTLNCAAALSHVAFGFSLNRGDGVVTIDQEYSSNYYPWKVACERSGARLTVVRSNDDRSVDFEKLVAAIVPGVKLVAVSWVQFQTGAILDLKKLGDHCHRIGAYLIVDGIQGIGQIPISFRNLPVDFLAGGSHKWMGGLVGQGFFAVKKELMEKLNPILIGSGTYNRIGTFGDDSVPMELTARRFEPGGAGFIATFAMAEGASLLNEVGVDVICDEISRLSRLLREGLRQNPSIELVTPFDQVGGITSFKMPIDAEVSFLRLCADQGIAVAKRGPFVRVSLHAFCTDEEVDTILSMIREETGRKQ